MATENDLPPPLTPLPSPPDSPEIVPYYNDYTVDYDYDFTKFLSVAKSMRIFPKNSLHNYHEEFMKLKKFIEPQIKAYVIENSAAKVHMAICANFFKMSENSDQILETKAFHLDTKSRLFFPDTPIAENLDEIFASLSQRIEQKLYLSSNFVYEKLIHADLIFLTYQPLRGYAHLPLPKRLRNNRFLINIKNKDRSCLILSVTAALTHMNFDLSTRKKQNPAYYYPLINDTLNISKLYENFNNADIDHLEKDNPNLSINVYIYDQEKNTILPNRISDRVAHANNHAGLKVVDLLFLHDSEQNQSHYVVITDLKKFCRSFHTKHRNSSNEWFLCRMCLSPFSRQNTYDFHKKLCTNVKKNHGQMVTLPQKGAKMQFSDGYKGILTPFVIFSDFECLSLKPTENAITQDETTSNILNEQIPYGYALKSLCIHEQYDKETILTYGDKDDLKTSFFKDLKKLAHEISQLNKINYPLDWSSEERDRHYDTKHCYSCESTFDEKNRPQIDHDHLLEKNNFRYLRERVDRPTDQRTYTQTYTRLIFLLFYPCF